MACCATAALTGCDQNLSATIYLRDVFELVSSTDAKTLPIDVSIEVLETGIAKQCSKPEGQRFVEAVASVFQKAALVGCEKISGSMNDRMVIKATTMIEAPKTTDVKPGPYLVQFAVHETDKENEAYVIARFNPEKYADLQRQLSDINSMARLKVEDAHVSVTLNNDERDLAKVYLNTGLYADGEPIDNDGAEAQLEPRKEVSLKFGDVKMTFLTKYGWSGVGYIRRVSSTQ